MPLINIDKFKDTVEVEINGGQYNLDVLTVSEYVNKAVEKRLDRRNGMTEYCTNAVEILSERSNIPREILESLTAKQMETLLLAMQGIDPALIENLYNGEDEKK